MRSWPHWTRSTRGSGVARCFQGPQAFVRAWTLKADMRSPAYTTRLAEVPIVQASLKRR